MPSLKYDPQGGKAYGMLKDKQDNHLSRINQQFLDDIAYCDIDNLEEKLASYKRQFVQFDEDASGDLNLMDVKRMMERLGQAKTHLELKKMIAEVDRTGTGVITYQDFVLMMLGKKSSILKFCNQQCYFGHTSKSTGKFWDDLGRVFVNGLGESYQRLKKWYLISPCLTLSIIRKLSQRVIPKMAIWSFILFLICLLRELMIGKIGIYKEDFWKTGQGGKALKPQVKRIVSRRILMFEEKNKPKEIPKGPPPKRDLSALP